jgi:quercetin dioxygenase-like cupin family protein
MHHPTTTRPEATTRQFVMGPEKVRATILTTGTETDGRHDLIDSVLPAHSMTPLHVHTRYEERVYVISGSLTVWVGPDKLIVGPGEYYHIPLHVPHTVQARSEDTHALLISSPAGFAERPLTWQPRRASPTSSCSWPSRPSSATSSSARQGPLQPTSTRTPEQPEAQHEHHPPGLRHRRRPVRRREELAHRRSTR